MLAGFVAMNQPLLMRLRECVRDLSADFHGFRDGQSSSCDTFGERLALEILHHEVVDVVLASDVEYGTNVGMVEAGQRLRFALEARTQIRVVADFRGDDLDRHRAIQTRVSRFVHLAHASRADQREDLVRSQLGARFHSRIINTPARACEECFVYFTNSAMPPHLIGNSDQEPGFAFRFGFIFEGDGMASLIRDAERAVVGEDADDVSAGW